MQKGRESGAPEVNAEKRKGAVSEYCAPMKKPSNNPPILTGSLQFGSNDS
jgi:hypothetical protein